MTRTCIHCGTDFEPRSGRQRVCNRLCSGRQADRKRRNYTGGRVVTFRPKVCRTCGSEYQPNGSNQRYCSDACKNGTYTCESCGEQFVPPRHTVGRFCSMECHYEHTIPTGSIITGADGYVIVKVPPETPGQRMPGNRKRWMYEHRYVMQQTLGRTLEDYETVHHINGKRDDNRPENLELWRQKTHPYGVRAADYHCPGCRCHEL